MENFSFLRRKLRNDIAQLNSDIADIDTRIYFLLEESHRLRFERYRKQQELDSLKRDISVNKRI